MKIANCENASFHHFLFVESIVWQIWGFRAHDFEKKCINDSPGSLKKWFLSFLSCLGALRSWVVCLLSVLGGFVCLCALCLLFLCCVSFVCLLSVFCFSGDCLIFLCGWSVPCLLFGCLLFVRGCLVFVSSLSVRCLVSACCANTLVKLNIWFRICFGNNELVFDTALEQIQPASQKLTKAF